MSKEIDVYVTERIDKLEDDRFEKMCKQVEDLHVTILGNGKVGLVQKVSVNAKCITILMWLAGITIAAVIGSFITGCNEPDSKEVIESLPTNNIVATNYVSDSATNNYP